MNFNSVTNNQSKSQLEVSKLFNKDILIKSERPYQILSPKFNIIFKKNNNEKNKFFNEMVKNGKKYKQPKNVFISKTNNYKNSSCNKFFSAKKNKNLISKEDYSEISNGFLTSRTFNKFEEKMGFILKKKSNLKSINHEKKNYWELYERIKKKEKSTPKIRTISQQTFDYVKKNY